MRVLFHHTAPDWSGRARAFVEGARLLVEQGVKVVFTCRPDSVVEHLLSNLPEVTVVPVEEGGGWLDESGRVRRVLSEHFSEVAIVHTGREHLVVAAALRRAERGAVLRRVGVGANAAGGQAERTAAFLTPSGFLLSSEEDRQVVHLPRRPLAPVVAPLGVDVESHAAVHPAPHAALGVPTGDRLLVCVTEAGSRASVATVLRAVALLAERHRGLRLVLVGPGSDHEDLRMHAAALGITGIVGFLGEREDRLAVLRAADVGWVVADQDDAAYAFLDFMALGVPVVAERAALAARYMADGITGSMLPPSDAPAAAAALAALLSDDEARITMGRAASARAAREFPLERTAEGLMTAVTNARDRSKWRRAR
ncbi:MAG TPA: glycosyltransferase [Gemmatimonadales bacterium]